MVNVERLPTLDPHRDMSPAERDALRLARRPCGVSTPNGVAPKGWFPPEHSVNTEARAVERLVSLGLLTPGETEELPSGRRARRGCMLSRTGEVMLRRIEWLENG